MIFDSLTHCTTRGKWFDTHHDASENRLLKCLAQHNVDKWIMSGLIEPEANTFVLDVSAKYPKRSFPVPMIRKEGEEGLQLQILNYVRKGAKGIKIHPRFSDTSLSEKWITNLLGICQKYNLAVFICTVPRLHEFGSSTFQDNLIRICINYPDVKFVLLHGGYLHVLKVCESVRSLDNVIIDLSATLPRFYDSSIGMDIKYLFRKLDEKLCIGTDFPEYTYKDVKSALRYLNISWESAEKTGVLGDNLMNFLNIK